MKRIHIAIATHNIATTIQDYSIRFESPPCVVISDEYALRRPESLDFSVCQDPHRQPEELSHLGWEDETAQAF